MNYVLTLDKVFSEFIRLRDAGEDGFIRCITCGARVYWKSADNSHFIRRSNMTTRWHEKNCHASCFECNRINHGELKIYEQWLYSTYGAEIVQQLKDLGRSEAKFSESDLKEMIALYRKKVKELKKEKDCSHLF